MTAVIRLVAKIHRRYIGQRRHGLPYNDVTLGNEISVDVIDFAPDSAAVFTLDEQRSCPAFIRQTHDDDRYTRLVTGEI